MQFNATETAMIRGLVEDRIKVEEALERQGHKPNPGDPSLVDLTLLLSKVALASEERRTSPRRADMGREYPDAADLLHRFSPPNQ